MMTHAEDDAAYLLLIDRHIEELKRRLDALRELTIEMVAREEDTAIQSELFCTLLQAIESMQAVRARELDTLSPGQAERAGLPKQAS
jgi:hypothetical protein